MTEALPRRPRLLLALLLSSCAPPPVVVEPSKEIDFKSELSRQGEWIIVAPYGRVWHPNARFVGPDFIPYVTGGGWVHGPEGWVFASEWKAAPFVFHYGRWFVADDLGWLWWPDQTRGAAFVEWRAGDGYTGWSPIPPPVKSPRAQRPQWFFTKTKYLSARDAMDFQLKADEVARVQGITAPLPSTGPDVKEVAALGGLDRDVQLPVVAPPPGPPPEPVKEDEPPPPPPKKKSKAKKNR